MSLNIFRVLVLVFLLQFGFANAAEDQKAEDIAETLTKEEIAADIRAKIEELDKELEENIWVKRYNNYITYRNIEKDLDKLKADYKKYSKWKGKKYEELAYQLNNKIKIKENELELIAEYKESPIGALITPDNTEQVPEVTNPFGIIEAWTYIDKLKLNRKNYSKINEDLSQLLGKLEEKTTLYKSLIKVDSDEKIREQLEYLEQEKKDFVMVVDIVSTTYEVYNKKIEQLMLETEKNVSQEVYKTIKIAAIIFVIFVLSFIVKLALRRYIKDEDDDQHYTSNKLVNFTFVILVVLILLFSYIDNASYLVTFIGFASAGIAIALKDWFMSIFGWLIIMSSGAVKVGDRVKVQKDTIEAVGDVIDISLFKITIREDITLTTYMKNRRSGRIFFIPNNYIFTDLLSNYTYDGIRTVWDGIDITITFESNHKKALQIAKDITKQYSKGYTDITRKSLNKLRSKYVLRSTGVEPRVFTFAEPYGIVISAWYFTNSYATLALRSTISMEILEAFKAADDIHIAYPTQTLRVAKSDQITDPDALLPGGSAQVGLFDAPNV